MVARCCCGHRVEPPAFLRAESLPVGYGCRGQSRVRVFDGPGEQSEFLTQHSRDGVVSCLPFARFATSFLEPCVELCADDLGDFIPFGARESTTHLAIVAL